MRFTNDCTLPRKALPHKAICIMLCLVLLSPFGALASNASEELTVGVVSTKTTEIYPLEPMERDLTSMYAMAYESLITIDDDYKPKGLLAERWDAPTGSGKTWTFYLRSGVVFSNGAPLTANDVVATIQYILNKANDEAAEYKGYYGNLRYFIESARAEDDLTVVIKASRSYYGLLYALTFPILPADYMDQPLPPGTGPYTISFSPQDYLVLTANDLWWHQPPQIKNITAIFHTSNKDIIDSYEYARVDTVFTRSISAAQYKSGTASLRLDYRSRQLETLLLNHSSFPLESLKVRQAIRYAIDVDQIAASVYMNMVSRTDTPLPAGNWLYSETPGAFTYDVEKAKALLAEEGWRDIDQDGILDKVLDGADKPKHLVLKLNVYEDSDNNVRVETANMIADMLAEVGIKANVTTTTFEEVAKSLPIGSYDMALVSYQMDLVPDPGFMLMSGNVSVGNYSRYRSKDMDSLFKTLRTKVDPTEFAQALAAIQQKFTEDAPFICLFYRCGAVLTRKMYTTARDVRELELLRGIENFSN